MYIPKYLCDMHTHSTRSDGNDTVKELIDIAISIGMKVLVLSDHDVRPPRVIRADGGDISPREYARSKGLCFIPGIEFSCDTFVDDVHIVGMGCDFEHPVMEANEKAMIQSKIKGYRKLTEILCEHGIDVPWDEILSARGPDGISRKPKDIQRKHIFEAIAKKGYCTSWQDAKIMVRNNPAYNVQRKKIDPEDAILAIHTAGGIAILAHPYLIDEKVTRGNGQQMTRENYIEMLINAGLDGIEAAYTYDKTSYNGTMTKSEIEKEVRQKYENRLLVISGGSDYHGDNKKGVKNPRMIGEEGITYEYMQGNLILSEFLKYKD